MKILALLGSPRKNKNTSVLLDKYLEGVLSRNQNADIEVIDITKLNIKGCRGCGACERGKVTHCSIKDDMSILYEKILKADTIINASPIYYFSITSQHKAVIDRTYALIRKMQGKNLVFLSTFGAETKEEAGYEYASKIFELSSAISGMSYVQNYGTNSYPTQIKDKPEVLEEVYKLGQDLIQKPIHN